MIFFGKKEDSKKREIKENLGYKDLDIIEIPLEAVAAYWLSLKKVGGKNWKRIVEKEKSYTKEPFIKHILDLITSSFDEQKIRIYANYKKDTLLKEYNRKFVIISIGVLGIVNKENPQQILIRIMSKFPLPPASDIKIYKNAQSLIQQYEDKQDIFVDIYHGENSEILIKNLLFYVIVGRKYGIEKCLELSKNVRSNYFKEGLELINDGFDAEFIKYRLKLQQTEILYNTEQKMNMSIEMAIALKMNFSYDEMFKIAGSFFI